MPESQVVSLHDNAAAGMFRPGKLPPGVGTVTVPEFRIRHVIVGLAPGKAQVRAQQIKPDADRGREQQNQKNYRALSDIYDDTPEKRHL